MNEFTEKELIMLKNGLEYLPRSLNLSKQYMDEIDLLIEKLKSMIIKQRVTKAQFAEIFLND